MNNRKHNATNPWQGAHKKVLCVCSAGLLRSPTAAMVLSQEPYNHNTRAAGMEEAFALIPVDDVLLHWADEVVCMTSDQEATLMTVMAMQQMNKKIICLNIQDSFAYRDPVLIELIKERYDAKFIGDS